MVRKQSPLERSLEEHIYSRRMLVFLEEDGGFRQVVFSEKEFKPLKALIKRLFTLKEGIIELTTYRVSDKKLPLKPFNDMQNFY